MDAKSLIFIYGLLRKDLRLSFHLSSAIHVCDGTIKGRLVDLGSYPAYVPFSSGLVVGEIWEIDEYMMQVLDLVEGYDPESQEGLYVRKAVSVTCSNGKVIRAQVYVWNMELFGTEPVDTGEITDYLVWLERKQL
jgi:gamma-glutamylcyclotransferase (GGCT)/AIG2-like uncharacterized protein YtfP